MNKTLALVFVASTLFLAGCCSTTHAKRWEYKVATCPRGPVGSTSPQERHELQQTFLNDLSKEGWVLIQVNEAGVFYLKRPIK